MTRITHNMGDAIPPTNDKVCILEWQSRLKGEKELTGKTVVLPRGFAVAKMLRDEYWVAHKMHTEFTTLCKANGASLPKAMFIIVGEELVGFGDYPSDDPHIRAFADCIVREEPR